MLKEKNRIIRHQILPVLAKSIAADLETMEIDFERLQEIRLRTDKPMVMIYKGEEMFAKDRKGKTVIVTGKDAVSYTHLDVYKRQVLKKQSRAKDWNALLNRQFRKKCMRH